MRRSSYILVVEDNEDDVVLLKRAMIKARVDRQVIVVHDGELALDFLLGPDGQTLGPPEVVLLDLQLPRLSGLETLKALRQDERTRYLPVVILTSSNEGRDIRDSYAAGANGYVRKPLAFEHFVESLESLGAYWLGVNEPVP